MTDDQILDALETAINNTHEMDVTDADYARACLPVVKAASSASRISSSVIAPPREQPRDDDNGWRENHGSGCDEVPVRY